LSISMKEFHDDRPGFLKTDRSDEIGDIARSFVIMKSELVNYHNHLEEMVEEKTKEVVRRIEEKEYINDTFGKIVDPSVRDYLLHKNDLLGGELVEATILFADIRGFTSLSERMTPKEIVLLLNRYFESVSKCIYEEKGIINKYIGDAIMAVFGVLVPVENHAKAAFESALKMKSEVQILNRKLREENFPEIRTGIGIHSGLVLAGNIGSSKRMEYTVIGDTVNIASRMESLSKYYNREIIISETTKNFLGPDYEISFLNNVKLKGREEKTNIYCPKEPVPLSIYTTGIDLNPFASG
ncbi:MAG: hypothetical protein K8R21_10940, partial [Leptospira sp.]|nr:hypothetical protein [Leptospira sp.]